MSIVLTFSTQLPIINREESFLHIQPKILHLTLKKKWFDMISSGEKKDEYREDKLYWKKRLVREGYWHSQLCKEYDVIRFKNGYAIDAATMDVECLGIKLCDFCDMIEGWYDEPVNGIRVFIIKLGKIISINNHERN